MNVIFPALGAGVSAGGILIFLSHVMPRFAAGNFIRDLDQPHFFGRDVTRREAHFLGVFFHLLISIVFAVLYGVLVSLSYIQDFSFWSLMLWGVVMTIFVGGIVLPLEGHGIFGIKEDVWFPLDLFITNILWSILFWWLMQMWLSWSV